MKIHTFRGNETYTSTSRIPTLDHDATPLDDALRRDFTINSLFYNVTHDRLEDWTGCGITDLLPPERTVPMVEDQRRLVTPLSPSDTFRDDPLRVLRAVRFSVRFGIALHPEVGRAAREGEVRDSLRRKVSRERVGLGGGWDVGGEGGEAREGVGGGGGSRAGRGGLRGAGRDHGRGGVGRGEGGCGVCGTLGDRVEGRTGCSGRVTNSPTTTPCGKRKRKRKGRDREETEEGEWTASPIVAGRTDALHRHLPPSHPETNLRIQEQDAACHLLRRTGEPQVQEQGRTGHHHHNDPRGRTPRRPHPLLHPNPPTIQLTTPTNTILPPHSWTPTPQPQRPVGHNPPRRRGRRDPIHKQNAPLLPCHRSTTGHRPPRDALVPPRRARPEPRRVLEGTTAAGRTRVDTVPRSTERAGCWTVYAGTGTVDAA